MTSFNSHVKVRSVKYLQGSTIKKDLNEDDLQIYNCIEKDTFMA